MITASIVKELRDKTNAGMMDCKKVLTETNGDLEASIKLLRERGIMKAGTKADRAATEGAALLDFLAVLAGAGKGKGPWAVATAPWPPGGGLQISSLTPKWSKPAQTPTTSTRASTAPTSWKCTCSGGTPWTTASASANRLNTSSTLA